MGGASKVTHHVRIEPGPNRLRLTGLTLVKLPSTQGLIVNVHGDVIVLRHVPTPRAAPGVARVAIIHRHGEGPANRANVKVGPGVARRGACVHAAEATP